MSKLSTSFTLGKASTGNANIEHNNRDFLASNIDVTRIKNNITYVQKDVRDAYNELFGDTLKEYNNKQTRRDRKIDDYFEHIENGSREEAYYEVIIQFGCIKSAPVGSENGEVTKKMLEEYAQSFQERNPRLRVFNNVLHADETCYHLHINFIPFYTEGRQKGLSKGVSMKAALIEQGFNPKSMKDNQLVMWENSELLEMEKILNRHGLERNVKGATHAHMTLPEYKKSQDEKKFTAVKWEQKPSEVFRQENSLLKIEYEKLLLEKLSPYKSFFYSVPEKQSFVMAELERLQIPFRETENGIEAKDCYVAEIRNIEKQYKSNPTSHREVLRNRLDTIIMQSKDFNEVLQRLGKEGYGIKHGKYIAVKPKHYASGYIRLKSLGEHFSEQAIRNRLTGKHRFESETNNMISSAKNPDNLEIVVLKTVRHYTVVFAQGVLPVRKKDKKKPFTWENDAVLDSMVQLNKSINAGATLESLRNDFEKWEKFVAKKEDELESIKSDTKLMQKLQDASMNHYVYDRHFSEEIRLLVDFNVTAENYFRLDKRINERVAVLEQSLSDSRTKLKSISENLSTLEKIAGGVFIQSLVEAENHRRQEKVIANGLKSANTGEISVTPRSISR